MSNDKLMINDDVREQLASIVDDDFNTSSMPELVIPKAGSLKWDLDDTALKVVRGTILCWQPVRVYYVEKFDGGNEPPDCYSDDGKTGHGPEGAGEVGGDFHVCKNCAFSRWGSDTNDKGQQTKGQACKQRMKMLFLVENNLLPIYINLPPSSLKAMKEYLYGLSSKGLVAWSVITELGLTEMKNSGGIDYNQVTFTFGEVLSAEEQQDRKAMRGTFAPMLAARPVVEPAMDVDKYTEEA